MKTIQIAPHREDCTITDSRITGTMNGKTYVFQLANGDTFNLDQADAFISCFQQAIALSSKTSQAEWLLNTHLGISGAKFYIQ